MESSKTGAPVLFEPSITSPADTSWRPICPFHPLLPDRVVVADREREPAEGHLYRSNVRGLDSHRYVGLAGIVFRRFHDLTDDFASRRHAIARFCPRTFPSRRPVCARWVTASWYENASPDGPPQRACCTVPLYRPHIRSVASLKSRASLNNQGNWCPGKDSNLHASRHTDLNRARLPIPPPGHWRGD